MATLKHIAVYLRVSTSKQDLQNQEPELTAWLEANANGRPVKWYRDTFTGKTMQRPDMEKLERAVHLGRVGSVVVWSTDRLGRTARELQSFLDELDERGIEFVTLRQGGRLDGSTAAGRMFRHMLIGFAEYEREVIGERTRAGMARARAAGKKIGGRKKGHRTRLTTARIQSIRALLESGTSKAETARQLGISERSIYRAVKLLAQQRLSVRFRYIVPRPPARPRNPATAEATLLPRNRQGSRAGGPTLTVQKPQGTIFWKRFAASSSPHPEASLWKPPLACANLIRPR